MKKIIYIILGLVLVGSILAMSFGNRQDALSWIQDKISERDTTLVAGANSIKYTTDKICQVNMELNTNCKVCFNFTIDMDVQNECIKVPIDSTQKEDDEEIKRFITDYIETQYSFYKAEYVADVRAGNEIR